MSDWEDLSDWYDKKQGETGDLWHRGLIDPVLLRIVGDCRGKDVLDLGCGNGYLARRLARAGANMTAIDSSTRMIRNAQAHDPENSLRIRYVQSDAARLDRIDDASFDLVFANMSLMDIEDAGNAIGEVSRVLRKAGGRFVASISHPCFDNGSNSGWVVEKSLLGKKTYRRIRAYRSLFSEDVPWRLGEGQRKLTRAFHRPLNWYARVLRSHGLALTALEEPEPTEEFLEKEEDREGFLEAPLHLVFEAMKL